MSSEENENHSKKDGDKKRARRTKRDEDGRDYVCTCGKSYLSYPALYTHIKTKHDGKAPQKQTNDDEDRTNHKQDLEQLKMFLKKYYPDRTRATPLQQLQKILSQEERDYIIPLLQEIEAEPSQVVEESNVISARRIFGKFIYDMNKRISPACIKFLVGLIMMVHRGVCVEKKNENYCDECTGNCVPATFNELILNNHIPIDRDSSQRILQDRQAVCRVLMYLANWMFTQKFTNYSVKMRP